MDIKLEKLALYIPVILSIGIGFLIIFITARSGIGVSPDSVSYIVAARDLFKVEFLKDYINWPPLLPLILGVINKIGVDPLVSSRYLNAICMSGIIYFGYQYFKLLNLKIFSLRLGLLLLFLSYPLLYCCVHLWTEPLFILFMILTIYSGTKYVLTLNRKWIITLIMTTALATLTRYAGIIYLCIGLTSIMFSIQSRSEKWKVSIVYVVFSLFPIGIWFGRNYLKYNLFREFFGYSNQTIWDNTHHAIATMIKWFIPIPFNYVIPFLLILSIGGLMSFLFYKREYLENIKTRLINNPGFVINIVFIAVYLCYLILFVSREAIDVVGDRYLIPVFFPMIVGIVTLVSYLINKMPRKIMILTIVLLFELLYSSIRFTKLSVFILNSDISNFASKSWQNSPTILYLKSNSNVSDLYLSNNVFPVKVNTLIRPMASPRKYYYNSDTPTEDLDILKDKLAHQVGSKLVWFTNGDIASSYYTLEELMYHFIITEEKQFDDGVIYAIKNK